MADSKEIVNEILRVKGLNFRKRRLSLSKVIH